MAKKFKFRLESTLKLRGYYAGLARESLAQAVNMRAEKERAIDEQSQYYRSLLGQLKGTVRASELQAVQKHKEFIVSEIKRLEKEKKHILEIESVRRGKLTEAMKNEKILEKLKEKKLDEHRRELNREETIFLDEVAGGGASRAKENL